MHVEDGDDEHKLSGEETNTNDFPFNSLETLLKCSQNDQFSLKLCPSPKNYTMMTTCNGSPTPKITTAACHIAVVVVVLCWH